jgi:hypothetical protein
LRLTLYLDIDGVILGKNQDGEIALIPQIDKLLDFILKNFDCCWLSTQSRHSKEDAINYLAPYFKGHDLNLLNHIKHVEWNILKTEAIDFNSPFIWIDDDPLVHEIEILKKKGCLRNWLQVDTYRDFHALSVELLQRKKDEVLRYFLKKEGK